MRISKWPALHQAERAIALLALYEPLVYGLFTLTVGVVVVVVEVTPPVGGTFTVTPPAVSVPEGALIFTLPPVAGATAGCVWVVVVVVCSVTGWP
jgi:hypothetical protein